MSKLSIKMMEEIKVSSNLSFICQMSMNGSVRNEFGRIN